MNANEKAPLVAICGRTNVGKSTLFNRLIEKRQALVSNIAGTTRDVNLDLVRWNGKIFRLADTAGLLDPKHIVQPKKLGKDIDSQSQKQAMDYLDQAKLIVFMVDVKAGLMAEDISLAKAIRQKESYLKKTLLVVNKVDSGRLRPEAAIFNKLGLGEPWSLSAQTGAGTGDLLDHILKKIKMPTDKPEEEAAARLCIVGKPNVGKSSLLNSLIGSERTIVHDQAHTTRESQDIEWHHQGKLIRLIDTAGISRHGHKKKGLEKEGMSMSLSSLKRADVALLVLDLNDGLSHQDAKMVEEIVERGKSLLIIANKWDLVEERNPKHWKEFIYGKLPFAAWAPILFVSAKTGAKVKNVIDLALEMNEARKTQLSETQLKKFLARAVKIHLPAKGKGTKPPHIYEITQKRTNPPVFAVRIGSRDNLHFSYVRFLQNRLREQFNFLGTPIKVSVVKNKRKHGVREQ